MGTKMNRELSQAARNSALSKCTAPLFLCDMNLHLCMFTERLSSYILPPTHGKSMIGLLPADLPKQLEQTSDGILILPVSLAEIDCHLIALRSDAAGEPCIVCILQTFDPTLLSQEKDYLHLARGRIASTVRSLLNTATEQTDHLSFACTRLARLLNIARFTDTASLAGSLNPHASTELIPYIRAAIAEFLPKFASVGGSLSIIREKSRIFYCACPPMNFGSVFVPLIMAAFCRSEDGKVQIAVDDADSMSNVTISIIAPHPALSEPVGSLDDLIGGLHRLHLDLLAAQDVAACSGIDLSCSTENGQLVIRMTVAYTRPGDITFHAPSRTADTLFLSALITQLFELCRAEKEQI